MKIAILSVATGKYFDFYSNFKQSIANHFFPNHNKTILLYTDKYGLFTDYGSIDQIPSFTPNLPWPLPSLLRFEWFEKEKLEQYDYVFYIDVDTIVVGEVNEEILPADERIIAVRHPLKQDQENHFEDRKISKAYVDATSSTPYYQACFFGGTGKLMKNVFQLLSENIRQDLRKCIIARWYDESHFNWYLHSNPLKELGAEYAAPNPNRWPDYKLENSPKIIHYNHASE